MASLNTNSYLQSTEWKNARHQGYESKQVDVVPTFWGPIELSHRCAQSRVTFPSIIILRVNSQVQLWKESVGHLSILFYSCSLCDKRCGHWSSHANPQPRQKSSTALPKPEPMFVLSHHTSPSKTQADGIRQFERHGNHPSQRPPWETHPSVSWKRCQYLATVAHPPH